MMWKLFLNSSEIRLMATILLLWIINPLNWKKRKCVRKRRRIIISRNLSLCNATRMPIRQMLRPLPSCDLSLWMKVRRNCTMIIGWDVIRLLYRSHPRARLFGEQWATWWWKIISSIFPISEVSVSLRLLIRSCSVIVEATVCLIGRIFVTTVFSEETNCFALFLNSDIISRVRNSTGRWMLILSIGRRSVDSSVWMWVTVTVFIAVRCWTSWKPCRTVSLISI